MDFRGGFPVKFTWVSTFLLLLFFFPKMAKTQMPGCSFEGLGLEQCLDQGKNSLSIDHPCCIVLNQAVQAGFNCLCLLLASSSSPLFSSPLLLPFSNCFISAPPLTQCRALVPVLQPPSTAVLPVPLPPDIPEEPPQPTAPNGLFFPPPPPQEVDQIPSNSTSDNNSTTAAMQPSLNGDTAPSLSFFSSGYLMSNGHKTESSLHSRFFLSVTLCACVI